MTEQKQVIPEGYKQTEVGVIPTDWDLIYIEECTTKVGSGKTPTGGSSVYSNHGRPFIRSQNVDWGKLELSDVAYISDEIHCTFLGSELKENDVLLNITGASIGRCAIADQRIAGGNVNQHVCIIRTEPKKFNPNLLVEFINSSFGQKQIDSYQAGGNREGLNFSQVKQLKFAIPKTLKEQTAIANALSDVDALISELEKLIAKKQAIKTATMQQLLTGKTRLPEFALREDGTPKGYKSSELGEIPEDWEVVLLSSLCDIKDGTHDSPKYKDSGVPLVTSKNIVGDILDMSDVSLISEFDAFEINKRSKVDKGDIIMSMIGTVGSAVLVVNEPNFCIKNILITIDRQLKNYT